MLTSPAGGVAASAAAAAAAAGPGAGITPATLYNEALGVLCQLILQLGFGYIVFEPIIRASLTRAGSSAGTGSRNVDKIESMQQVRYQRIVERLLHKVQLVRDQLARAEQRNAAASSFAGGLALMPGSGAMMSASGGGGGGFGVGGTSGMASGAGGGLSHLSSPLVPASQHQNLLIAPDLESYHDFKLICFTQGIELNDLDDFPNPDPMLEERGGPSAASAASASADGLNPDGTAAGVKKLHVSQQNLMKAWAASHRSTNDDWVVWMRGFSIELLKESPSSALRACSALAQKHSALAKELFNAAFVRIFITQHARIHHPRTNACDGVWHVVRRSLLIYLLLFVLLRFVLL
jgi:hypothetical protein